MELSEKLRVARRTAGLTQKQVFERCGIDDSALSEFENAKREPKLAQLHRLAETYRIPLSSFFQESLPQSQLVMWRNADEGDRDTENQFLELCRQYHQLEMWTSEVCDQELARLDNDSGTFQYPQVVELAEKVRRDMALGERPGESLHRILEEVYGVKIFCLDLDSKGVAACAYSSEFGSAILLNVNCSRWWRNHDLAHELFHLLTWKRFKHAEGVCGPTDQEEKFATCFAGNLLLPETPVRTAIKKAADEQGRVSIAKLDEIARQFDVSLESFMWRMHFLFDQDQRITKENLAKAKQYVSGAQRDPGPKPPDRPERYRSLAIRALQEGEISLGRFAEFMGISRKDARRFVTGRDPEYAETKASVA